jgi:hypothetical protein
MTSTYGLPLQATVLALAALATTGVRAADEAGNFQATGFLSLVAGKITSGTLDANYSGPTSINNVSCPCYIADWGNAGIYDGDFSLKPESRVGLQLKYAITPALKAVGQVVIRGSDTKPNLQWAFLSYTPSRSWEIQAGRKRIPLYYYSDFQDIGFSYPWVTPPPELYGWEATNYNGASVRYKGAVGEANASASLFSGRETVRDSLYQRLYYADKTKVVWSGIAGGDVEVSSGALTVRAVYLRANVHTSNPVEALDDRAGLKAFGVAANLDFEDWFILAEATQLKRNFDVGYSVTAPAMTIGVGYRFGDWTPFLNHARYKEKTSDLTVYAPQSFNRSSITLRYDLDPRSALKVQVDRERDATNNFGGNATIFRVAYDRLF